MFLIRMVQELGAWILRLFRLNPEVLAVQLLLKLWDCAAHLSKYHCNHDLTSLVVAT